ncbi:MAG: T9SS type A sorting domain-containing protein [Ignavibacteriales bacterium]|nr:T9SS type A sorting domain-containing protein [Ignavibacteriales bacterium]
MEAGIHAIKLSGKNLSSGVYILRLIGEGKTKSVKLIVQK